MDVRMMIPLDGVLDADQLMLVAVDDESRGIGRALFRKPGAPAASVSHVAELGHGGIIGGKWRGAGAANTGPDVAQRHARCRVAQSLARLEKRARHRGIVAQGWRTTGWRFSRIWWRRIRATASRATDWPWLMPARAITRRRPRSTESSSRPIRSM